jgi:uncharacterized damage-inducible protein DinB
MTITAEERQAAIDRLGSSRDSLHRALEGVTDEQANFTPEAGRWCILELVEHLAVSDPGILTRVQNALSQPAQPELKEKAAELDKRFTGEIKPLARGVNKAPEALVPKGAFPALADAAAAFDAARDKTIAFARDTQDDLRSHFFSHSVFGPMDCYQWVMACALHAESHTRQIEALKVIFIIS